MRLYDFKIKLLSHFEHKIRIHKTGRWKTTAKYVGIGTKNIFRIFPSLHLPVNKLNVQDRIILLYFTCVYLPAWFCAFSNIVEGLCISEYAFSNFLLQGTAPGIELLTGWPEPTAKEKGYFKSIRKNVFEIRTLIYLSLFHNPINCKRF